jgi:predicted nucleotidyltransferase
VFDGEQRHEVRRRLLERARQDDRIVGAAVTGSAARDAEDRWSDVDLFFGVARAVAVAEVLGDWSAFVYRELGAIHHFDVHAGAAVYRAFLLGGLLEVDLGFAAADGFGPLGDGEFRVVFGDPVARQLSAFDRGHAIGLAWHHVLHARICLERGARWQAQYWISAVRDHVVALACHRLGYPTSYAKGADLLPVVVTERLQETLVRTLDSGELVRALAAATTVLLDELAAADPEIAAALTQPLLDMAALAQRP